MDPLILERRRVWGQAKLLAERYGAKIFKLDRFIKELVSSEKPWGYPPDPTPPPREPWGKKIPVDAAVAEAEADLTRRIQELAELIKFKLGGGMTPEDLAEEEELKAKEEEVRPWRERFVRRCV